MQSGITTLMRQAQAGDVHAALAAARHPNATPEHLEELATFGQDDVRRAVAEHPGATPEILSRLVYDPCASVVVAVARHKAMPGTCYEQLTVRVIADALMQSGRQRAAIMDIGVALASNPDTPDPFVKRLLAEIPNSQFVRILARDATRVDVLRALVEHPKATVRETLAGNPALPTELLRTLALDSHDKVARAAEAALEDRDALENPAEVRAEVLRERYESLAVSCDADRTALLGGDGGLAAIGALVDAFVQPGATVVDVACDTGFWLARAAERAPERLIGLDLSPAMLALAAARLGGRAELVEANALPELPLETGTVDTILCIDFLQCVTEPATFFAECRRVLKPDGRLVAVIRCVAGEGVDGTLYADAAARHHWDIPLRAEAEEMMGTSGLVIERMDPALIPVPVATAPGALAALADGTWKTILDEAAEDGAMAADFSMGLLIAVGRNVRF